MLRTALLVSEEIKQRYVAREISKVAHLTGIIIEKRYTPSFRWKNFLKRNHYHPVKIFKEIFLKALLSFYQREYPQIIKKYFTQGGEPIPWPEGVEVLEVSHINSPLVVDSLKKWKPDIIVVFGTSIVKKPIMEIPPKGIINVHTGLSPYYRGGQSAFWCLYNEEPEYIGVTVHFLDEGIDSGDIIFTARPSLSPEDNLAIIECKLALLATELLKEALKKIEEGSVRRIKQWMKGKLYLNKMFTLDKRILVEKKLRRGLLKRLLPRIKEKEVKIFPPF